jgi:hypothetical protein
VKGADGERVGLYSISANPSRPDEFCVCGCDAVVRVYDRRAIRDALAGGATTTCCLKKLCPDQYVGSPGRTNVTSAEYNHDGTEIAANYKDDDVYLFRVDDRFANGVAVNFEHRYEGRRNNSTGKYYGSAIDVLLVHTYCWNTPAVKFEVTLSNFLEGAPNRGSPLKFETACPLVVFFDCELFEIFFEDIILSTLKRY